MPRQKLVLKFVYKVVNHGKFLTTEKGIPWQEALLLDGDKWVTIHAGGGYPRELRPPPHYPAAHRRYPPCIAYHQEHISATVFKWQMERASGLVRNDEISRSPIPTYVWLENSATLGQPFV